MHATLERPPSRAAVPAAPASVPVPAQDAALALYRDIVRSRTLPAAGRALAAGLRGGAACDAVWVAVQRDGRLALVAGCPDELPDSHSAPAQALLAAMDEALEQAVALAWPPAGQDLDGPVPVHATLAHRAWRAQRHGAVATVPLGHDGEVFGAVAVHRAGDTPFTADELAALEHTLLLALPALRWLDRATEPLHRRARRSAAEAWQRLRQPDRRRTRRFLAGAGAALLFAAVAPLDHEVAGRARIEGAEQRVLAAPADGFVKSVHARPGDTVHAGDALVDLLDGDLKLERERWSSQLAQHENGYAAAMGKSDRAAAATALARVQEAQAQLALVDEQLQRGRVVAPFDGLVVDGDLAQAIGAPVKQGDKLVTLASAAQHRVIVAIDETDIARVQPGQRGALSLSAFGIGDRHALVVERITPLARAVDGRNVFEVQARLAEADGAVRPGLLGRAWLVVGRRPPLWVWAGHVLDRVQMTVWAWS